MQAIYSFGDSANQFHVFRHRNGEPVSFYARIIEALVMAYPLPRFEPPDFAAAFVRVCKGTPGDVRLLPCGHWSRVSPSDCRQRYIITEDSGKLILKAVAIHFDFGTDTWFERELFSGDIEAFKLWAVKERDGT